MTTAVSQINNKKTKNSTGVALESQLLSTQGNKKSNKKGSNTDADVGNLLLEQAQQIRDLEEGKKKLESERDTLHSQCKILAEKIKQLESDAVSTTQAAQSNQCEISPRSLSNGQTLSIDDLPMIDPSEFQPVVDQPEKETAVQRLFRFVRP